MYVECVAQWVENDEPSIRGGYFVACSLVDNSDHCRALAQTTPSTALSLSRCQSGTVFFRILDQSINQHVCYILVLVGLCFYRGLCSHGT